MTRLLLCLLLLVPVTAQAQDCYQPSLGLDPVQPTLTLAQREAGMTAAAQIVKRLPDGTPSSTGRIIYLPVGMSNTMHVFSAFQTVAKPFLRSGTRLINTAQSNQTAAEWADPACPCWAALLTKLAKIGTPAQVGAVFLMVTNAYPPPAVPPSPAVNATLYAQRITAILGHLRNLFPNLQIVYLSSNYYAAYLSGTKTPEPHGHYEHLQLQALQDASTGRPFVRALSLWADGVIPRHGDQLTMLPTDLKSDRVHLSLLGKPKYGQHVFTVLRDDPMTYHWLWQ